VVIRDARQHLRTGVDGTERVSVVPGEPVKRTARERNSVHFVKAVGEKGHPRDFHICEPSFLEVHAAHDQSIRDFI